MDECGTNAEWSVFKVVGTATVMRARLIQQTSRGYQLEKSADNLIHCSIHVRGCEASRGLNYCTNFYPPYC